jgi:signal transduction histidine kinase
MKSDFAEDSGESRKGRADPHDVGVLVRRIVSQANLGAPRVDFLREVTALLLEHSGCDLLELMLAESVMCNSCLAKPDPKGFFEYANMPCFLREAAVDTSTADKLTDIEWLCRDVFLGKMNINQPFLTKEGSFWTGDIETALSAWMQHSGREPSSNSEPWNRHHSLAIIPLVFVRDNIGLLLLGSRSPHFFDLETVLQYQGIARDLGFALVNHRAQAALRERVKEQTCLYGIAQLAATPEISLSQILQGIAELLPPGWQYPEITAGQIVFDGDRYSTPGIDQAVDKQSVEIVINGVVRGTIEVVYRREMPELDEGPFLKEERSLIDTIAREVAMIAERKLAEEERARLRNQLIHADRLATIGQLAAGVAHELNEPLGSILGFAQLARKQPDIPEPVSSDVDKIVKASLHAREVVRKLLLFARQMPPRKQPVNLNDLVANGLYFLESRCAQANIKVVRRLSPELPNLPGDSSQLHQVLVNLVVNAIQSMPDGGTLTIRTGVHEGHLRLQVEDTGVGIDEDVMKKVFLPFFTTKDIHEGTGLGLAVVHGIVTAHGGTINLESKKGEGTRFDVCFPMNAGSYTEDKANDAHKQ